MLKKLISSSKPPVSKKVRFAPPHDLEIWPNERWDTYQVPFLTRKHQSLIAPFNAGLCSKEEFAWCLELEKYIRYLIFEDQRWRPATNTSAMITLNPKDGIGRRYWVNGNLIGMREVYGIDNDGKPFGKFREICVMVQRYPQFPTFQCLQEYVRSRIPYENVSRQEIQCIACQIEKRFSVVGRLDVRAFYLRRRIRYYKNSCKSLIAITLEWDMPREFWGSSSWKAYFEEDAKGRVFYVASRVACHIDPCTWIEREFPPVWLYPVLPKGAPPIPRTRRHITTRALTWLQFGWDPILRRKGVSLSLEDDPITGMLEEIPDGVTMDSLTEAFDLLPPEPLDGTSLEDWVEIRARNPTSRDLY